MKEFKVNVIQNLRGNYKGKLQMFANSREEFIEKINSLQNYEIEELVESWETENLVEKGEMWFENIEEI